MLQLPVPSDSSLKSKRNSFDSGYASPKKINSNKHENQHTDMEKLSIAKIEGKIYRTKKDKNADSEKIPTHCLMHSEIAF